MSEEQKEYTLGIASGEYKSFIQKVDNIIAERAFKPSDFGTVDGSFNGTIYRSFDGKLTFKESNGIWVILASNGSKIPLVFFRGAIESNDFAEKLFKSFEVIR